MTKTALSLILIATLCALAHGHGAMVSPAPRSSHNQTLDRANRCGCQNNGGCYSKVGLYEGEYCGVGCIGESCLYYQIGCFQGCASCSMAGKTLYPVPADLASAGCPAPADMPAPTLGGGDRALERALRTYNIDNSSKLGDWTKWNPWRSPGSAGRGNPEFQPCGVNSGAKPAYPLPPAAGAPAGANGTDLPPLPGEAVVWRRGVVEASWAIYANHGGGYQYRLCKKTPGQPLTEECYQKTPLAFATNTTEIRYTKGDRAFLINATTTSVGTYPAGSQWRKNPIPMCNCDQGVACKPDLFNKCSADNPNVCHTAPYPNSHRTPGQQTPGCESGLQFESSWPEGYGPYPGSPVQDFVMVDKLEVPELEPGEYSLSWRWDCEETPQVWNSCADVSIAA